MNTGLTIRLRHTPHHTITLPAPNLLYCHLSKMRLHQPHNDGPVILLTVDI